MSAFPGLPITAREELTALKLAPAGAAPDWRTSALQLNLHALGHAVVLDGVFGAETSAAVVQHQRDHGLKDDGIAGPATMQSIALTITWPLQAKYRTPPGLARGMIEGESGFDLACVSAAYANGTRDLGGWQLNRGHLSDPLVLLEAFDMRRAGALALGTIASNFATFRSTYYCTPHVAWQLAALAHNRPADADALARASAERADIVWSAVSDRPGWFTISGHDYSQREWDQKYVADKTKYATL